MIGIKQRRKFLQKVMIWLDACSKSVTSLVILDEEIVDQVFGNDWIFQQDGTKLHWHHLTQQQCRDNFLSFIDKNRWLSNSTDLNR